MAVKRRIWQAAFLFFLNLPFLGQMKYVCVPVLNCHSCPWAVFACPVGVVGHFAMWGVVPLLALGTIAFLGALFGRILCGWVCPFGLLQDMLHKIPSPKLTLPRWTRYVKYVLLVGAVLAVPFFLGVENYAFFCKLCPAGTLESLVPRSVAAGNYPALASSWIRLAVMVGVLLLAVVSLRSFCRVFCPIGATLALCNRFSAFSIRYHQENCPSCRKCLDDCPMGVRIDDFQKDGASEVVTAPSECILCLNCTHDCHQAGLEFSLWSLPWWRKKQSREANTEG